MLGDEPLLFHTGFRRMFPLLREAVARIIRPEDLRWIAFGHYEADECGAMNEWLAVAPHAEAAHGHTGCLVSLNDMADRTPRMLAAADAGHAPACRERRRGVRSAAGSGHRQGGPIRPCSGDHGSWPIPVGSGSYAP